MIAKFKHYLKHFIFITKLLKNPRVRKYSLRIISTLIILSFIFFAIKPTVADILDLQKKVSEADGILKRIEQKIEDLNLAKTNYDSLGDSTKNKIQLAIPDTATVRTITQSLEKTALKNGASISALQLQSFTVEQKEIDRPSNLAEIEFTFNIDGPYQNLISFLQDIKTSSRLITINSLSFQGKDENQNLIMSITGKVYFMK